MLRRSSIASLTTTIGLLLAGSAAADPGRSAVETGAHASVVAPVHPFNVQRPAGRPKGIVLGLHGGGWRSDPGLVAEYASRVGPHWTARGWVVHSTGYTTGRRSLADVLAVYDRLKRRYRRVIVTGESAGGHLALMVAARRSTPFAVLVEGAITDPAGPGLRPDLVEGTREVWGPNLARVSPATLPLRIAPRRVLLSNSVCDDLVMPTQMRTYRERHPGVRTLRVPCGDTHRYTHRFTTLAGVRALDRLQVQTVRVR
ncbi:MAG: lysophospholipase [Solirubrobacteraceae bacterium]|nr:lysophospholipase [Solirubrobacteraceae bacterium]